jgi:hypothetical protein
MILRSGVHLLDLKMDTQIFQHLSGLWGHEFAAGFVARKGLAIQQDRTMPLLGKLQGTARTGNSRADDQHIGLL